MDYIRHVITSACSSTLFIVFVIAFAGYVAGRIQIKGVGLGTAGVFLAALVFGHFGYADGSLLHAAGIVTTSAAALKRDMSLVQNIGLLCFVTAVGFIAGPGFFHNLRKNARSYVLLAAVIIGEVLLGGVFINFALKLLAAVIGAVIYYAVITLVLRLGLETTDLKLLTALVVALFLTIPYWKGKYFSKAASSGKKEESVHA